MLFEVMFLLSVCHKFLELNRYFRWKCIPVSWWFYWSQFISNIKTVLYIAILYYVCV